MKMGLNSMIRVKSLKYFLALSFLILMVLSVRFLLDKNLYENDVESNAPFLVKEDEIVKLNDVSQVFFKDILGDQEAFPVITKGFGLLLHDNKGNMMREELFTYKGKALSFYATLVNSNNLSDKVAFMIVAGDRPQKFKVDGKNEDHYLYILDIEAYSYLNIPISFEPLLKERNIEYPLKFVVIRDLDKVPANEHSSVNFYTTSGHYKIIACNNAKIHNDLDTNYISSTPLREDLKNVDTGVGVRMGLNSNPFEGDLYRNFIELNTHKDRNIYFEAYGVEGAYSTIIVLNNELVLIKNYNHFNWEIDDGEMIQFEFELDKNFKQGVYQLYSISFPTSITNGSPFPSESQKYLITIN